MGHELRAGGGRRGAGREDKEDGGQAGRGEARGKAKQASANGVRHGEVQVPSVSSTMKYIVLQVP